MKIVHLAPVLLVSFILAACGGGGGGSSDDDMTMMPPPPEMCPEGQEGTPPNCETPTPTTHDVTLPSGVDATEGMAEIAAGMTADIGDITFSCPAGGEACSVVVAADGTATSTGGAATAAESQASLDRKETARMAAVEAATKAAGTKRTAIQAEADQATEAGLGGDETPTGGDGQQEGSYNLNIKHGETSIVKEAAAEADNETFTQADMDLGDGTTMHVLTMDADTDGNVVEEVVMVHTDVEAPKATAFAMVAGQALNARDLDTGADGPDGDGDLTNDFTALTVGTSAAVLALVMSSEFTSDTRATLTFDFDDASTTSMDEADEVDGTYNGAMGTYRCNGTADCTVTLDGDGKITAMSTGWVFTPDAGATSDVPDADFLHYGFWLQRTTDSDGVLTYNEVETFAGSSIAASGDVSDVTGKATYSGDALGVYVHSVTKPDGTEASATSGHFTADVALTAYFGQVPVSSTDSTGTIAPNLLNKLSGTINNFMLSGHDQGPGWSVTLEESEIAGGTGTVTGTDMAKGGGKAGDYSATFHGSVTAGDDGTVPQPHTVVGEFNAFFSNGSVAGAFGARKD